VQKAAEAGFHLNDVLNGMVLKKYSKVLEDGVHGNHPAYTTFIQKQFDDFVFINKNNITAEQAKSFIEDILIPQLKGEINQCSVLGTKNLNEYFKSIIE